MKLYKTRHVHILAHHETLLGEMTDGFSGVNLGLIGGVRVVSKQAHHEHILVSFDLKLRCGLTCTLSGKDEGFENGTKYILFEDVRGDERFTRFIMVSFKIVPTDIRKRK